MKKIATVTVGAGGAASIDFASIPATYTDLLLVVSARVDSGATQDMALRFNGSSIGYGDYTLMGNGSSVYNQASYTDKTMLLPVPGSLATTNLYSSTSVYIPNYLSSTNKTIHVEGVVGSGWMGFVAGTWTSTSAITSLSIIRAYGTYNYLQNTTATLYGVAKGSLAGVTVA